MGSISDAAVCHTVDTDFYSFFCKLRIDPAYLTAKNVHVSNCVASGYVAQAMRSVRAWLEGDEL
ncbi:hypothetical protein T03_7323 [Trichinella britovi]|uniref:Uncharacterized protein n=1 Tax=Trichinella britovi TaxID=45882 RepID=A0A0V1D407_TRIBR|nr:hypothetical protein T03_7323 [Trichinella britovi]